MPTDYVPDLLNSWVDYGDGNGATSLSLLGAVVNNGTPAGHYWSHDGFYAQWSSLYDVKSGVLTAGVVPEPETYALLLAGLGILGVVLCRRKVLS
jgi:hypothetical protein